ncbi:GNAT family N-acetyltransferase [Helicobacter mustelae]|nr:GNAT family N-acetyltransferase [Helicobacter mustelae]SQH72146.1 periplasmic protein [Helicobacter mustelae]
MTIQTFSLQSLAQLQDFYAKRIADNPLGFIQRLDLLPSICDFVHELRKNGGEFWEVSDDGKLIGICGLAHIDKMQAQLCKFHIAAPYQGLGLGKRLYGVVEQYALSKGYAKISLHVSKTQIKACKLYEKLGFLRLREEDCIVSLGQETLVFPTIFMEKILS